MRRHEITYMDRVRARELREKKFQANPFAILLFVFVIGYFGAHLYAWSERNFCVYPQCEGIYEKTNFQR